MLGLLTLKVLLEKIDFVVLLDAFFSVLNQIFGSKRVAKVSFSKHLLLILCNIERLSVIKLLGPT